jgi:hypothetical protein
MSGRQDAWELPAYASFDDFWLIELDLITSADLRASGLTP